MSFSQNVNEEIRYFPIGFRIFLQKKKKKQHFRQTEKDEKLYSFNYFLLITFENCSTENRANASNS